MKKSVTMLFLLLMLQVLPNRTYAQSISDLAMQIAIDLDKLIQLKNVLSELKKGYEVVSKGYNTVKGLTEGNFNVHKVFLDGLLTVSPTVRKYRKIPEIINFQISLVKEGKNAIKHFRGKGNFTPEELSYMADVYGNLYEQSLANLDELISVTTAGKMRMSDDERLNAIDRIHADMEDKLSFVRNFNDEAVLVSVARERQKFEINSVRAMQGIQKK